MSFIYLSFFSLFYFIILVDDESSQSTTIKDETKGIFLEENINIDREVYLQLSRLNSDVSVKQYVTYTVELQEACDETIGGELTRDCDNFKLYVTAGQSCISPPDWSNFSDTLDSVGVGACEAEEHNHVCTSNMLECPNTGEIPEGTNPGDALVCCVIFICDNINDDCTLKAKSTFSLKATVFESNAPIKTYGYDAVAKCAGLSEEPGDNLFSCVDKDGVDLGCQCVEVNGNTATLKFSVRLDNKGPIYGKVRRKETAEDPNVKMVQIGEVVFSSIFDYTMFLIGLTLFIGLLICCFLKMKSKDKGSEKTVVVQSPPPMSMGMPEYSYY
eukprot:GAHX01002733.1.p1 GENE.GAHX01002733.1~~GAHX01002733.1.p1  ORF type:complete len:329 (-),score=52.52 GAHX01002733.1:225-1211(-)